MNCHEIRQHSALYLDSEGDAELHFRINEHLAMCPACAEWFHKQGRLEGLIAEKLRAPSAPSPTPGLWDRVLKAARVTRPAKARRWVLLAGVAAGVAACVALVGLGVLWFLPSGPDLARLTASWHEQLSSGSFPVEYASRSDLDVDKYLRRRVTTFKVRCPPRQDAGFAVEGAGVGELADQPTAYLTGHVEEAPVSIFILRAEDLAAFPHQWKAVRREGTHRCQEGAYQMVLRIIDANAVLVIGQTDSRRLERVLNAYASYPDHEG